MAAKKLELLSSLSVTRNIMRADNTAFCCVLMIEALTDLQSIKQKFFFGWTLQSILRRFSQHIQEIFY